jgi:xylan 1,4-beta-xylosidase
MQRVINPVIPGFSPDPSICRVGEDYYLVVSSFEYFPSIPVFHSRDLVNWRQIGHCIDRESQLPGWAPWHSTGMQAPTIRHIAGRFYVTCTTSRNFIVSADDPAGPWSDPVWVEQPGIDPSIFQDDDGKVYYTNSYRYKDDDGMGVVCIGQSEIDLATGAFIQQPRVIWGGTGGQGPEAPHLYKVDGRYYLMIAEGGTEFGHMETLARSDTPWGPWETCPHNPIFTNRSTNRPLQVCGHGDMVEAPDGSWWMVYLAVRPIGYHWVHVTGRETCLAPVQWNADGWPVVGEDGRLPIAFDAELPHAMQPWPRGYDDAVVEKFAGQRLDDEWNFIRHPRRENYRLGERPGCLTLLGAATSIDSMEQPTWVGRRQRHIHCGVQTLLHFAPGDEPEGTGDGQEAGLSVYQNWMHHYDLAILRRRQRNWIVLRRRIGNLVGEEACLPVDGESLHLRVEADAHGYAFHVSADGERWQQLGWGEARYLSTEVGGRFTGVYFALYATGNGKPCCSPAYFEGFRYEPHPELEPGRKGDEVGHRVLT